MSRDAFIGELRHRMAGLPQQTVERTVEYYSELIADSVEDGMSEEEAVARLGSLEEIVANVVKDTPLSQIVQTRVQEKKAKGVSVTIWTHPKTKLTVHDIETFNAQYPSLEVRHTTAFHDRFLILDGSEGYLVGASLKDAGKRSFAVTRIEDAAIVQTVLSKLDEIELPGN